MTRIFLCVAASILLTVSATATTSADSKISRAAIEAMYPDLIDPAKAIFSKREGAYGTALIERGDIELCADLEVLREKLDAIDGEGQ